MGLLNDWRGQLLLRGGWVLLFAGLAAPTCAQTAPPTGGLRAEYYEGINFDKQVLTRRDATIAFDWGHQPPAPGVPAEYFSVRWTGWLVPPASGRYVFHITVDDGMRIWVNNQLILNEWRGQPRSTYAAAIDLKAGEPYHLRVDYCQYILDTRAQLTWERPDAPKAPPPSSWRTLWGLTADPPRPEPIPARYLFAAKPAPAAPTKPAAPATTKPFRVPASAPAAAPKPVPPVTARRPAPVPPQIAVPPRRPTLLARPGPAAPPPSPPSLSGTRRAELLADGISVTLPELYFEQGQAKLLPAARLCLDSLAPGLAARPGLRLEVQGHTDNVGNAELNRQLSQQRAEVVCLYLTAHGVAAGQLRPVGYGGTQPVADNVDPAQRPRNRRVVLRRR